MAKTLPDDIIVEILSQVPVKSLLRFRCVSKSWLRLISNPQFVKYQLNISCRNYFYDRTAILSVYDFPIHDLKSFSLHSTLYGQSVDVVEPDYPSKDPDNPVCIVGGFNGLVCIVVRGFGFEYSEDENSEVEYMEMFLWNPTTRKSMKLPSFNFISMNWDSWSFGFFYDEFTDDYVVVVVFSTMGIRDIEVVVYTRRTDSWRRIQNPPSKFPWVYTLTLLNGAIHWVVSCNKASKYPCVIVSLDLQTEKYGEVAQPNYGDGEFDLKLGVFEGCLCVISIQENAYFDIWIMKEYGVVESWCKLFSIPYMLVDRPPLFISKNGEVLFISGTRLVIYNSRDGTFSFPPTGNRENSFDSITFVESLVSPSIH